MGSPSKDLIRTEDTLRGLIEHLIDAQEGLQKIGDDVKDEALKRHFLGESLKRAQYRGELENILHQEGERDLHIRGTAEGTVVRAWAGLKAALGGGDQTLLATADEAEDTLVRAYAEALAKDLPFPIREVLAVQASHVQRSREYVGAALARMKG